LAVSVWPHRCLIVSPPDSQHRFDNVAGGARTRQHLCLSFHRFKTLRAIEQAVDFVGQRGKIVTADCDTLFEEVIGITLFLSRDGSGRALPV
jgi:hypothetical protein